MVGSAFIPNGAIADDDIADSHRLLQTARRFNPRMIRRNSIVVKRADIRRVEI